MGRLGLANTESRPHGFLVTVGSVHDEVSGLFGRLHGLRSCLSRDATWFALRGQDKGFGFTGIRGNQIPCCSPPWDLPMGCVPFFNAPVQSG